jgi:hypothetical protein
MFGSLKCIQFSRWNILPDSSSSEVAITTINVKRHKTYFDEILAGLIQARSTGLRTGNEIGTQVDGINFCALLWQKR